MPADLLAYLGPEWSGASPASGDALDHLRLTYPLLPSEYYELLAASNGGEGSLGVKPGWFRLWPAEEVEEANRGYEVDEYLAGWVGIGSNGGGELFVLDEAGQVRMVPFIPMEKKLAEIIAPSVAALARLLGHQESPS